MNKRHPHLALLTALLLLAALLRLWNLVTMQPGFSHPELAVLNIMGRVQLGEVVVFHRVGAEGQETAFSVIQAFAAALFGDGLITLRLPAVWIGLITLSLTYALTRRLYGWRAGLLAFGLMAVGFWPVLLARLAVREALVPLAALAALLAFLNAFHIRREVSPDPPLTASYTALGLLTALSLYAHWYGVFLALVITLAAAYLLLTRQRISRRAAGYSAFAILVSIITVVPYVISTLRAPGSSGLATLRQALTPVSAPDSIIDGVAALFFRGDFDPVFNLPGRPLLEPVSAALFAAGVIVGLRRWRQPTGFIPVMAALVGLIPLLLGARAGSFLALVGALPLIYLMIGRAADLGLSALAARRPAFRRVAPWLLAALVSVNLVWTVGDLFIRWPARPDVQEAYHASRGLLAHHLDRTVASLPTTVCSPQLFDTDAQPGDPHLLAWMMQRQDAPLRYVDCANGLIIAAGGARQQFAFTDPTIFDRMHAVLQSWLRGRPNVPVPGLPSSSVVELNVQRQLENTVGRLLTTAPTGFAPESPGGPGAAALPVRMGGNLSFLGYVPERDLNYAPGDVVPIVTYWRVDGAVPPDVRLFAHVLSDPVAIVAQTQAINVWASTLRNRDVFIQVMYVVLPDSVPPGAYDISIGAYLADSQARLPVFDGEQRRGDRLFLYQITVTAGS